METPITLSIHGITLAGIIGIFCLLLSEHKVWVRMKDRLNQLWKDRCVVHGDDYVPLENGHR
jgi:hypothetical protein